MKKNYRTIHEYGYDEIVVNKSKFIGYAKPVLNEEDALSFIKEIKGVHKDATHNVYAYVVGENSNVQRYSDDGEPSGTAGIPVLEVIKKEDLKNVVVVVTRYFGGIKLGAGGLIRAYTKGAKIGLEAGKIVEKILFSKVRVRIDYTLYGKVENDLLKFGYTIADIIYDDMVNIIILSKTDTVDELINLITELTNSKMIYEILGEEYFSSLDGKILR